MLRIGLWNRGRGGGCSILFHDRHSGQCPDGDEVGVGVLIVIIARDGSAAVAIAYAIPAAATKRLLGLAVAATVAVVALKRGGVEGAIVVGG